MAKPKFITKADMDRLPALYSQDGKGMDAIAYTKWFCPFSRWTWYATEYDPETHDCFGYVISGLDPDFDELGYFSLDELAGLKLRIGDVLIPAVERDRSFRPQPLCEIIDS